MRLYGRYEEDFNSIKHTNTKKYVKEHYEEYKKLIYAYTYYKENYMNYYKAYNTDKLKDGLLPERWKINLGRLLKIIDIYCDTQEEFDEWLEVVNASISDYQQMLMYPKNLEKLQKTCNGEEFYNNVTKLKEMNTFTERNTAIDRMINGDVKVEDTATIWDFEKEIL